MQLPELVKLSYGTQGYVEFQHVHNDVVLAKYLKGKNPRTFRYHLLRYDPNYAWNDHWRVLGMINHCNRQRVRHLHVWLGKDTWPPDANLYLPENEWEQAIRVITYLTKELNL